MAALQKKHLGQNFLIDAVYINKILQALHPKVGDNLIEIGPGVGALTAPLLQQSFDINAIEIDSRLPNILNKLPNASGHLKIILQDVLQVDFAQFNSPMRIFGNLPYNISTPLLTHLLQFIPDIQDMHFMLQKEVVERIVATPGNKDYGRLSIFIQYYCSATLLFYVPAAAFDPPPKVESAVVRLIPYKNSPYPEVNPKQLFILVGKAFAMRRKTLLNNLKTLISKEELLALGIDPCCRPENLHINDYIKITNFLYK